MTYKKLMTFMVLLLVTVVAGAQSCPDSNHPHAIDLGLPSGTKWACCNVGATTPEKDGGYYAWGETEEKSSYKWETYKLCNGSPNTCSNIPDIAGGAYDVAKKRMGNSWNMPTSDDFDELKYNTSQSWATVNGINGMKFTGTNGNSIFLPASGLKDGSSVLKGDKYAKYGPNLYWTSKQSEQGSNYIRYAKTFWFQMSISDTGRNSDRYIGHPVRAIFTAAYPLPESITIKPTFKSIKVGEIFEIEAAILPTNANPNVSWSSDNPTIASVLTKGESKCEVTGLKKGQAVITARTVNGLEKKCYVTVEDVPDSPVMQVSAGVLHSLFLLKDGTLWACGNNDSGQFGNGTIGYFVKTPEKIMGDVASVSAGSGHSLILKKDGTLWACGRNDCGQLGDGTTTDRLTPIKIMNDVAYISAGYKHSLIVKSDGTLWGCGENRDGQLGDGTQTEKHSPVKILTGVVFVSAGHYHSLIVKNDGTLWACGDNTYGQLGTTAYNWSTTPIKIMNNVASISAGPFHSLIVKKDGTLWACGKNETYQLGDGTTTDRKTPIKVLGDVASASAGENHSISVMKDGSLMACGAGSTAFHKVSNNVESASAGRWFTLFVKKDNTLWAYGNNQVGQLGNGTTTGVGIDNPVMIYDGKNWTASPVMEGIAINATNFPDINFRNYLLSQDYGTDGKLTEDEIKEIIMIDVSEKNISSLKGIENFTALITLTCNLNQLTTLDVSENTALKGLVCYSNQLTTLDVSKNKELAYLDCSENKLVTLDVSKNTALMNLYCLENKLSSLDVSKNVALQMLYCYSNQLTTLDVSKNTALKHLTCDSNKLTSLDVSKNLSLTELGCSENLLSTLDISKNTALINLYCGTNKLSTLDVSKNTKLEWLSCYSNKLTTLDVSKNPSLTWLACYSNQIKGNAMDVLVNSLNSLSVEHKEFEVINLDGGEGNVCTKSQVAIAKGKGWNVVDSNFNAYEGSDDVVTPETPQIILVSVTCDNTNLDNLSQNDKLVFRATWKNIGKTDNITTILGLKKEGTNTLLYMSPQVTKSFQKDKEVICTYELPLSNVAEGKYWANVYYYKHWDDKLWWSWDNRAKIIWVNSSPVDEGVKINATNFPDENFRNYLLSQDYGKDGVLTEEEIKNITKLPHPSKDPETGEFKFYGFEVEDSQTGEIKKVSIKSLKGIEYFTALTEIHCDNNQLTSLDVSKNTALTWLDCYNNQLTSLDVSKNTALTYLDCYNNQLTSLDVSKNTALDYLDCSSNQLTSLDVSKNTALTNFKCYDNFINGLAMDALVNSLNNHEGWKGFIVIDHEYEEGNVCTKSQVAIAKGKGWDVLDSNWQDYEGSDDEPTSQPFAVILSSAGYATFYDSQSAYTLPNGLSAQVVTGASNSKLTYKTIADGSVAGVVPKGTAVMLVSDNKRSGTYTLTSSTSTTTYSGTNLLRGSNEATTTTGDGYHYKLSYGQSGSNLKDVFGWYWGAQNGEAFHIEGHKAWLVVPKSTASTRGYIVDGETTGIETMDSDNGEAVYYDLQGRRISRPTSKGVYIKNGKKTTIK